ncbi:MAG: undecaprenyldiphospho-muramoylpentapeptide beta-N-acetylglucosaminyltransferase [Candidatus Latescibacteria bacterium]|nr:undecaprenyldiphospho-muramoylpentapeptide beta-N-acetylglucosaminyltransferase [Candidatus Latescibacterota bacterium]
MPTIILTGGGTAGHVTPNMALIPALKSAGYDIHYIGTQDGIEHDLINDIKIPYHAIPAGKLRRYIDWQNLTDLFRIKLGFIKAFFTLGRIKPDVVFSKGGFVTPPVVWAAWLRRIPVIIHESDITPGLANKLALPFANHICHAFAETAKHLPANKAVHTGIPVREELRKGDAQKGRELCGFSSDKPVLLIIGGSLGAQAINKTIRSVLPDLLKTFQICHLCGRGNLDKTLSQTDGYAQFEYISDDLPHIFAATDFVISRAGATTLFELLTLHKPALLIPLSARASRGDQILNAQSFKNTGYSLVLSEDDLTPDTLLQSITDLKSKETELKNTMSEWSDRDAISDIVQTIRNAHK